jgi:hypothetical protein
MRPASGSARTILHQNLNSEGNCTDCAYGRPILSLSDHL